MKLENHGGDHAGDQREKGKLDEVQFQKIPIIRYIRILEWLEYGTIEKNLNKNWELRIWRW